MFANSRSARPDAWGLVVCLALASAAVLAEPTWERTATVRGRVIKKHEGTPLRYARVVLESVDSRALTTRIAGADGAFEFTAVAPGRYRVAAAAPGFATTEWEEDVSTGRPGRVVRVAESQVTEVVLRVAQGGVITGRIVDVAGRPVEGVPVHALQSDHHLGREVVRPVSTRPRFSDDNGVFRLFGLERGSYYVAAAPADLGADLTGYAPTFFPGTQSSSLARAIEVLPSQEYQAGDFAISPAPKSTVTGVVLSSTGAPVPKVELLLSARSGPGRALFARATSAQSGRFSFENLTEGEYLLQNLPDGTSAPEFGSTAVVARGDRVEVALRMERSASFKGVVVFEGADPAFVARDLSLVLRFADMEQSPRSRGARIKVADDGTVEATDIWGPQYLQLLSPPEGWMLAAVNVGTDNFVSRPLSFDPRQRLDHVRIVLTNQIATISGEVTSGDGPDVTASVLLFSEDEARWSTDHRSIHSIDVDERGRFKSPGLPPDSYLVAALEGLDRRQGLPAPAFLDALRAVATRVSISAPGDRAIKLQAVRSAIIGRER